MELDTLNSLTRDKAHAAFASCCHSDQWAAAMSAGRPYTSFQALLAAARRHWSQVSERDLLAAFAAHPLIGDVELPRAKFAGRAAAEQGQVLAASTATLTALAECNRRYYAANGFIFIICATGQSADGMLAALKRRLANDRATELRIAAGEQMKITEIRLQALLGAAPSASS